MSIENLKAALETNIQCHSGLRRRSDLTTIDENNVLTTIELLEHERDTLRNAMIKARQIIGDTASRVMEDDCALHRGLVSVDKVLFEALAATTNSDKVSGTLGEEVKK